jgi:hypothetical protein
MSLAGIHVDDYGYALEITVNDKDTDTSTDISTYTTRSFLLRDPAGTTTTKTALFKTDGTDGALTYTVVTGDIDQPGRWQIQVQLSDGSSVITSDIIVFSVLARVNT